MKAGEEIERSMENKSQEWAGCYSIHPSIYLFVLLCDSPFRKITGQYSRLPCWLAACSSLASVA